MPCSCWKSTVHSFRSHILLLFTLFMIISFCKILISHAKWPMKVYNHSCFNCSTLSYSKSTVIDTYTLQMRVSNPKFLVVLLPPIILLILTTIIRLNLIIYVCIYIIFGEWMYVKYISILHVLMEKRFIKIHDAWPNLVLYILLFLKWSTEWKRERSSVY